MNMLVLQNTATQDFYSREGYRISLDDERWKLNKDFSIPVFVLASVMNAQMYLSFRHVLAFYAKTSAPAHTRNLFERCKHYIESTAGQPLFSVESLISYRSMLDKKTEWYLGTLRGLIRRWADLGYIGIPSDTLNLLDQWTLKGNDKGYSVQSMCPDSGPLTDIEMEGVVAAVIAAYGDNRIALIDACYAMTLAMTGRRPNQITGLKQVDLIQRLDKFFINFPRAKRIRSMNPTFQADS